MGVILPAFETLRGGVPTRRTPPRSGGEFSSLRGGVRVGDFPGVLKTPPRSGGESEGEFSRLRGGVGGSPTRILKTPLNTTTRGAKIKSDDATHTLRGKHFKTCYTFSIFFWREEKSNDPQFPICVLGRCRCRGQEQESQGEQGGQGNLFHHGISLVGKEVGCCREKHKVTPAAVF